MHNRPLALVILTIFPLSAFAAKQMTLDQLQQLLSNAQTTHQSDIDTVRQLSDVELTAPVRPAFLHQLLASSPGPRTTQAIRSLADLSVFLDPSAVEIPSKPAPDFAAQKDIMAKTIHYVARCPSHNAGLCGDPRHRSLRRHPAGTSVRSMASSNRLPPRLQHRVICLVPRWHRYERWQFNTQ